MTRQLSLSIPKTAYDVLGELAREVSEREGRKVTAGELAEGMLAETILRAGQMMVEEKEREREENGDG